MKNFWMASLIVYAKQDIRVPTNNVRNFELRDCVSDFLRTFFHNFLHCSSSFDPWECGCYFVAIHAHHDLFGTIHHVDQASPLITNSYRVVSCSVHFQRTLPCFHSLELHLRNTSFPNYVTAASIIEAVEGASLTNHSGEEKQRFTIRNFNYFGTFGKLLQFLGCLHNSFTEVNCNRDSWLGNSSSTTAGTGSRSRLRNRWNSGRRLRSRGSPGVKRKIRNSSHEFFAPLTPEIFALVQLVLIGRFVLLTDKIVIPTLRTLVLIIWREARAVLMTIKLAFVDIICIKTEEASPGFVDNVEPLNQGHFGKPRTSIAGLTHMVFIDILSITRLLQMLANPTLLIAMRIGRLAHSTMVDFLRLVSAATSWSVLLQLINFSTMCPYILQ